MFPRVATALVSALVLAAGSSAQAEVRLTIRDGRVSLVATDATLRQVLAEWERVGGTRIINGDRVPGGPLTLQLDEVSESQALGVLLRSIAGYVAAPRAVPGSGASRFDRIMIMPTAAAPRVATRVAPPAFTAAAPAPGDMPVFPLPEDPAAAADGDRPVRTVPAPSSRGAVFNAFPRPQVVAPTTAPAQPPAPSPQPNFTTPGGMPVGSSVPGMIVPAPPAEPPPTQPDR